MARRRTRRRAGRARVIGTLADPLDCPTKSHHAAGSTPPMGFLEVSGVLVTLAAVLAFINHKVLRLPTTIGLMLLALLLSGGLMIGARAYPPLDDFAREVVGSIDFNDTLMHGLLGFLLFAGALHVQLAHLRKQTWVILSLATVGVVVTTALVGLGTWALMQALGLDLPLMYAMLFGSLIAPTDPIAVLAVMKKVGAPQDIETKLAGESLFNDGVGVVVFLALLGFAIPGGHGDGQAADPAAPALISDLAQDDPPAEVSGPLGPPAPTPDATTRDTGPATGFGHAGVDDGPINWEAVGDDAWFYTAEVGGGLVLGGLLGGLAFVMLRWCDDYPTEVLITLALVTGGYVLARRLHVSGPLAMVIAGLLIGNPGRAHAMSDETRRHLDTFWELIDAVLNAVLFVLIGLEVFVLAWRGDHLLAGVLTIPVVLLARFLSVGGAIAVLRQFRVFTPHAVKVMTWAGLRGGISVAMALALKERAVDQPVAANLVLTVTYVVVAFSIIVQGLTVAPLLKACGLAGRFDPYAGEDDAVLH